MASELQETSGLQDSLCQDSSTTRAEKVQRNGLSTGVIDGHTTPRQPLKRSHDGADDVDAPARKKGIAPIKPEYVFGFLFLLLLDLLLADIFLQDS